MSDQLETVKAAVGSIERMVAADGGKITVKSFSPTESSLIVEYDKGRNDRCETCVLDDDSVRDFIQEALHGRGVNVNVTVEVSA